jgi:hypothetical protein
MPLEGDVLLGRGISTAVAAVAAARPHELSGALPPRSAGGTMTVVSHPGYDRLLMGSPLRRSGVCLVLCSVLLSLLAFACLLHLTLIASMRSDVAGVFFRALALSSVRRQL